MTSTARANKRVAMCATLLVLPAAFTLTGVDARAAGPSRAAAVDQARLEAAAPDPAQWMSTGRTYDEQRFSPLTQINKSNIAKLSLAAWYDIPTSLGQEATPIVVDGVMYVSTDWSIVKALDARSGKLLWSYDPKAASGLVKSCCGPVNRGVAVWQGKVFVGTLDGRLVALDAATGKVLWDKDTVDQNGSYNITGAPRVIRNLVLIGNGGGELGVRGYLSAYNAETGKLVWRFYTVPGKPGVADHAISDRPLAQKAASTWFGEYWKLGGGGTVWDSMAYDPELNLLYFGTDNGSPWNHGARSQGKGDNLFLASIMAVRADTGAYVWHYQVNPAEAWDFSATQQIILADLKIAGRTRKVLMQVPKNGFLYVLDRVTGELLSAKATVPMTWATGVDMKTGRPIENPQARYYNTGKPFVLSPSGVGAHNWQPMSFSPLTGLLYVPMNQTPLTYIDARGEVVTKQKTNDLVQYIFGPAPANLPIGGWLAAWDPVAGREVWRAPRVGPWNGGVLSTAGGLVFQGTVDGRLIVNAAADGKELWNFDAQTGVMAGPISYAIDGEQYVAVAAGWGGALAMGGGGRLGTTGQNRVLIFKLDGKAVLPAKPAELVLPLNPPSEPQSAAIVAQGRDEYGNYCARCHGQQVLTGGVTPDLLRTPFLNSDQAWYSVVLDGALATKGMAGFGSLMDKKRAASIRAYVISEAQKAKASEAKH